MWVAGDDRKRTGCASRRDLHHPIRNALDCEVQDIFDNPATLDAGNHVFDHDTAPVDINIDAGRNGPARNNPVTYFTDRRMDT